LDSQWNSGLNKNTGLGYTGLARNNPPGKIYLDFRVHDMVNYQASK